MRYGYKKLRINKKCIDRHRFIMESCLNRKLDRYEVVHHINGNPTDDNIENLSVVSLQEHSRHHMLGRIGSLNNGSKLTEEDVLYIKYQLCIGITPYRLARMYPVKESTIRNIKNGSTWKHV